jgi:hypothetical protein
MSEREWYVTREVRVVVRAENEWAAWQAAEFVISETLRDSDVDLRYGGYRPASVSESLASRRARQVQGERIHGYE